MKCLFKVLGIVFILLLSFDNVYAQRGCCSHHGGVSGGCRNGKQVCKVYKS